MEKPSNAQITQSQSHGSMSKTEPTKKSPMCWILTTLSLLYLCASTYYVPHLNQLMLNNQIKLDPTYANKVEARTNPLFHKIISDRDFFESKKYGEIISIDPELQDLAANNVTVIQLLSEQQDGPTCLKYAFSNLFAIRQLHKNGKAITAKNIAQEIELPLKTIGFPGLREWKAVENPTRVYDGQADDVLNYEKIFFPDGNINMFYLFDMGRESLDLQISAFADMVANDLNTYGASYTLLCHERHATTLSIIKNKENNYLIVYMDSNNEPHLDLRYPVKCNTALKNLIINLNNKIHNKPLEPIRYSLSADGLLLLGAVGQILFMTCKTIFTKLRERCFTNKKESTPESQLDSGKERPSLS